MVLGDDDRRVVVRLGLVDPDGEREIEPQRHVGRLAGLPGARLEPVVLALGPAVAVQPAVLVRPRRGLVALAPQIVLGDPRRRVGALECGQVGQVVGRRAEPVHQEAVGAIADDRQVRGRLLNQLGAVQRLVVDLSEDLLLVVAGGRDCHRHGLLARAGSGRQRRVEVARLVRVELVDHVAGRVEAVLQLGVAGQDADHASVFRAGDVVLVGGHEVLQRRAGQHVGLDLVEHDRGLALRRGAVVDLRRLLVVGDQQIQRQRGRQGALPVFPRDPEQRLLVDAQPGGGVDLEQLVSEVALEVLEDQRLAGPAALRLPNVAVAEHCEPTSRTDSARNVGRAVRRRSLDSSQLRRRADLAVELVRHRAAGRRALGAADHAEPRSSVG